MPTPIVHDFTRPKPSIATALVEDLFQPAQRFESLTEDQIALLDATDILERLADRLGSYARVQSVLRTVAMIHGEDLERPRNRCLLDGSLLSTDGTCPRCGRDNN